MQLGYGRKLLGASALALATFLTGCASKPATQVVLLPQADGTPSAVKVQSGATPAQTLSEPYQRLVVRADTSAVLDRTTAEAVRKEFPALFSTMPPASARSVLLFQAGGTALTAESQVRLTETRDEALRRSGAELVVIGHTDTKGSQASNDALSLRRAQQVRDLYIEGGFPAARIEAVVNAHKNLLANASHELRTPLARIRIAVELLAQAADPKRKAGLEQDIAELDHLIDEILLTSRLDAISEPALKEALDLHALAAEEVARYTDVELDGEAAPMHGDPWLLRRLLRNLLENAQRHGQPPIKVRITQAAHTNVLQVSDAGTPIPPEQRERLFEPFYRRSDAREGAGLGLALVRQIARRHGGEAQCVLLPDGHNAFVVSLPCPA